MKRLLPLSLLLLAAAAPLGTQQAIEAAGPLDWRRLDPDSTLYMELATGRVVIELAPEFAPKHVANMRKLARAHWYDGAMITRVQENYVTQWGDATESKPLGEAAAKIGLEVVRPRKGLAFKAIPGREGYARRMGFAGGFPVAVGTGGEAWLTHCYAMVGAGRGDTSDSGNGAELYTVIGQAPRHLDRNVTLVGRVVQGMEKLTALPRGTGPLGVYETAAERVPVLRIRLASEVPPAERTELEVMRTDTAAFAAYVDARAHRSRDGWFVHDAGFADLCNIRVPVRPAKGQ